MAIFYTKGTVSYMSDVTEGTSQNGTAWSRMTLVIDVPGYNGTSYKMAFTVGTNRVPDVLMFNVGHKVEVGWSIYAREWNGKWFSSVDLVNIKPADAQSQQAAGNQPRTPVPPMAPQAAQGFSPAPAPAPAPAPQAAPAPGTPGSTTSATGKPLIDKKGVCEKFCEFAGNCDKAFRYGPCSEKVKAAEAAGYEFNDLPF